MAIKLFGFKIGKDEVEEIKPSVQSFAPPPNEDGTIAVTEGGAFGTTIDMEGGLKNDALLITRYRQMASQPECERAIDDVINEAIVTDELKSPVDIVVDYIEMPLKIRDSIRQEFNYIRDLMNFDNRAYDIFRNWYVDGRLYYHIMIDSQKPNNGIVELRHIDPRKLKKIRVEKKSNKQKPIGDTQFLPKEYQEYYIYAPKGVSAAPSSTGIKISCDSIAQCTSGLMDELNQRVLSHMHKAIKPLNQLRMLEDATVIYRLARAPERRVFYIDVGNLPKAKAEQYLRDMMVKHKNKLVYDANTGEVRDDRKFMTMLEDYWLPRREGGKGTEITTLPPGQNLGEIEDVIYFRKKLYESLNVPISRLESENSFNIGRNAEITRDEVKFSKFVQRLRKRFSEIFTDILGKQLLLKGIITKSEWKEIRTQIGYDYLEDNHFSELKDLEVMRERLSVLADVDQYVDRYYSVNWIRKNVLRQTEEDIQEIQSEQDSEGAVAHDNENAQEDDGYDGAQYEEVIYTDEKKSEIEQSQLKLIESMTKFIES